MNDVAFSADSRTVDRKASDRRLVMHRERVRNTRSTIDNNQPASMSVARRKKRTNLANAYGGRRATKGAVRGGRGVRGRQRGRGTGSRRAVFTTRAVPWNDSVVVGPPPRGLTPSPAPGQKAKQTSAKGAAGRRRVTIVTRPGPSPARPSRAESASSDDAPAREWCRRGPSTPYATAEVPSSPSTYSSRGSCSRSRSLSDRSSGRSSDDQSSGPFQRFPSSGSTSSVGPAFSSLASLNVEVSETRGALRSPVGKLHPFLNEVDEEEEDVCGHDDHLEESFIMQQSMDRNDEDSAASRSNSEFEAWHHSMAADIEAISRQNAKGRTRAPQVTIVERRLDGSRMNTNTLGTKAGRRPRSLKAPGGRGTRGRGRCGRGGGGRGIYHSAHASASERHTDGVQSSRLREQQRQNHKDTEQRRAKEREARQAERLATLAEQATSLRKMERISRGRGASGERHPDAVSPAQLCRSPALESSADTRDSARRDFEEQQNLRRQGQRQRLEAEMARVRDLLHEATPRPHTPDTRLRTPVRTEASGRESGHFPTVYDGCGFVYKSAPRATFSPPMTDTEDVSRWEGPSPSRQRGHAPTRDGDDDDGRERTLAPPDQGGRPGKQEKISPTLARRLPWLAAQLKASQSDDAKGGHATGASDDGRGAPAIVKFQAPAPSTVASDKQQVSRTPIDDPLYWRSVADASATADVGRYSEFKWAAPAVK